MAGKPGRPKGSGTKLKSASAVELLQELPARSIRLLARLGALEEKVVQRLEKAVREGGIEWRPDAKFIQNLAQITYAVLKTSAEVRALEKDRTATGMSDEELHVALKDVAAAQLENMPDSEFLELLRKREGTRLGDAH